MPNGKPRVYTGGIRFIELSYYAGITKYNGKVVILQRVLDRSDYIKALEKHHYQLKYPPHITEMDHTGRSLTSLVRDA
ncbi:hypothetical protein K7432_006490 [Basidiobolus ranarum]|uniref:Uncharacterized protein n=1 Tax=Basidiobolus ranarum TaxID=34480 RepID=A0ABR2WUU4_9FUNG